MHMKPPCELRRNIIARDAGPTDLRDLVIEVEDISDSDFSSEEDNKKKIKPISARGNELSILSAMCSVCL